MPQSQEIELAPDWRGKFPFRIAAPSWVLPLENDNLVGNVRYLCQSVDRVQLLLFGADYLDEMLIPHQLQRLVSIRAETGLAFSVHLPADLKLLASSSASLSPALNLLERVVRETECLEPESYILHLDGLPSSSEYAAQRLLQSERVLAELDTQFPQLRQKILIENTNWNLAEIAPLLAGLQYGVCADFGHAYHHGQSLQTFLDELGPLIRELHLHGFNHSGDHLPLAEMDPDWLAALLPYVARFDGTITMELFHAERLWQSLSALRQLLTDLDSDCEASGALNFSEENP